jgi:hypothetical protein
MMWIGWLIAVGLGLAFYKVQEENNKAQIALVTVQSEIAKLAGLWAGEIQSLRALDDEHYKMDESVASECLTRYRKAEEPFSLFPVAYVEDLGSYMFRSNREPWNKTLLFSDPVAWGKQLVPFVLSFNARP